MSDEECIAVRAGVYLRECLLGLLQQEAYVALSE